MEVRVQRRIAIRAPVGAVGDEARLQALAFFQRRPRLVEAVEMAERGGGTALMMSGWLRPALGAAALAIGMLLIWRRAGASSTPEA